MENIIIHVITDKTAIYANLGTIIITLVMVAVHSLFGEPVYWDNWIYTIPIFIVQFPLFVFAQYKLRNVNKESKPKIRALKTAILNWTLTFGVAMYAQNIICTQTPAYYSLLIVFPLAFIVGFGVGLITKE